MAVVLMLVTLAVYWPALRCHFVSYDDPLYVTSNVHVQNGLTWESISWAFRSAVASNWHPLTMLSDMLDCQLFGLDPWGHHLTSILLHSLNAVLVFLFFRGLTGANWRSLFVSALFALHPLRVESVAWVSERKDVLSAFFGLLSLIFYARYARQLRIQNWEFRISYGLALFFLALGLMSKAMLVTWPFVMLLLDYWPLNRMGNTECGVRNFPQSLKTLVVEKIPFLALAIAASVVTLLVQQHEGAVETFERLGPGVRVENALISYCRYLGEMFWPVDLAIFYPHPGYWPLVKVLPAGALMLAISTLFWIKRRRYPFFLMGWLWFLGTLVPVIGLIQVGEQALADRYTYLPSMGVLIVVAWGAHELARCGKHCERAMVAAATTVLVLCIGLTWQQLGWWRNSETLFRHALKVTTNNYVAHADLGIALGGQGRIDEAIQEFQEAIRVKPNFTQAHYNLGSALSLKGQLREAISQFQITVRLQPGDAQAHNSLGAAFFKNGQTTEAIQEFQEALRLKPDYGLARKNLATTLEKKIAVDDP
jgi:tetratricopeptide (TPR) repeat protein